MLKAGKVYESQIKMVAFSHSNYTLRWYTSAGTDSQLEKSREYSKINIWVFRNGLKKMEELHCMTLCAIIFCP